MGRRDLARFIGNALVNKAHTDDFVGDPGFYAESIGIELTDRELAFLGQADVKKSLKECAKELNIEYGPGGKGAR